MNRFTDLLKKKGLDFKQHQHDGVQWCVEAERRVDGPKGGFLADEMGLGKTITMIGLFVTNFVPRTLIVVPAILVEQWYNEVYKVTGHKSLICHRGEIDEDELNDAIVVITTYGKLSVQKNRGQGALHDVHWDRVVFDEAHHLRNGKTGKFLGASSLEADTRWLVTGTPVQNRLKDLKNLGTILGVAEDEMDDLSAMTHKYMLRRTKEDVGLVLPGLETQCAQVSWTNEGEKRLAEEIHASLSFSNVGKDKFKNVAEALSSGDKPMFRMLSCARQSCTLPQLMAGRINYMISQGIIPPNHPYKEGVQSCSKSNYVIDSILSRINNGNGKLVFCQFHKEMDLILKRLREAGVDVAVIDGRGSLAYRKLNLTEKHDVLILQIQTGCEGLNLQEHYSEIYFASPHWNPAVEDQAVARCHRIGQTKPVQVFRFIMEGWGRTQEGEKENAKESISFDKHVSNVQDAKRDLWTEAQ